MSRMSDVAREVLKLDTETDALDAQFVVLQYLEDECILDKYVWSLDLAICDADEGTRRVSLYFVSDVFDMEDHQAIIVLWLNKSRELLPLPDIALNHHLKEF
ncbi:hypothetical protein OBBRIDRAFT_807894 [Obba rivulosa]|uniref:Uncharacterized protein n=1 Tax=Obba rivulosa TaxID=1052685 RepID=A0A8E2AKB1_9APHY|nr:hypothetical protein OBBRIDRAFT_807894 [Obba rivulosa]